MQNSRRNPAKSKDVIARSHFRIAFDAGTKVSTSSIRYSEIGAAGAVDERICAILEPWSHAGDEQIT